MALTRAPWWAVLPLALWVAVTSIVTALGLLLLKRPRAAWAELTSLGALDPLRGTLARWRTRHRREVRGRDLRALFEPQHAVLSQWGDAVHDALVPPSLPMADEDNDLAPRSWVAKVVRHPGVLATVGAAAVAAVAGRSLGPSVVTGAGSGLAGGELVGSRASARTLWHAWTDGWTGAGLGGPEAVGPHVPLLAGPAWLADRLPLVPDPSSPAGAVVAVAVILGMPLAAASAYVSFRTMVTSRVVRGLVAFAWATTGVAAASVAQGRLGAVVALVLLPPLASGFWLMATRRSTATSAFATAFAAVLVGAFVPVLLALSSALALVIAVGRSRVRLHALVVAVVPLLVLGPWLVTAADTSWPVLVAGVGVAQWGGTTPPPWQLALLHTGGPGAPPAWAGLPLVAVAVLALFRGRTRRAAATTLAVCIPVLLAVALVAPAVRIGTVPAGLEGAGQPITLWSGTLLLPLALVLVLALARGLDGIRLPRPRVGSRVAAVTRWTAVTVSAVAVTAGAVGVAWATLGSELTLWRDPRPAVSVEQAEGAFATRVLFVAPGERGSAYRLVGREAADLVRPLPVVAEADRSLATRVTGVLGDPSTAPALFADTATDLLAVRAGLVPELTRRLDATEGLQRIAPRDGWDMWRVSPAGSADGLVAPPRLRIESPSGILLATTTGQHAATSTQVDAPQDSRLVVAEAPAWTELRRGLPRRGRARAAAGRADAHLRPAPRLRTPHHHRDRPAPLVAPRPGWRRSSCWPSSPSPSGGARPGSVDNEPPRRRPHAARRGGSGASALAAPDQCCRGGPCRRRRGCGVRPRPCGRRSTHRPRPRCRGGWRQPVVEGSALTTRVDTTARGRAQRHPRCSRHRRQGSVIAASAPAELLPGPATGRQPHHDVGRHAAPGDRLAARRSASRPFLPATRTAHGRRLPRSGGRRHAGVAARPEDLRGLATAACAAGGSDLWLLGGGADPGRQERLVLTNPGDNPVTADVTVHGAAGPDR